MYKSRNLLCATEKLNSLIKIIIGPDVIITEKNNTSERVSV